MYVYGEKIMDLRFKHAVVKAIIRSTHHRHEDGKVYMPVTDTVNTIYGGTLDGSPARKLLVDLFMCYGHSGWMGDFEYDPGFLRDLVLARMQINEGAKEVYKDEIEAKRYREKGG